MTVDRELIATRVAKIREQLRHLSRLDAVSRDAFLASTTEQHAVERELKIVIEACLDIGHHVISREGLRRPGDYRDVFTVLREAAIVEAELGRRLEESFQARRRVRDEPRSQVIGASESLPEYYSGPRISGIVPT